MRPGTMLLIPVLAGLFAAAQISSLSRNARAWLPFLLATILGIGSALSLQQLTFGQITDSCGAIGGNQGLTLYGMSKGLDWNAGVAFGKEHGIQCERTSNALLKKEAWKEFLRNPAPAMGVIADNLDKNNHIAFTDIARPGRRSWYILIFSSIVLLAVAVKRRLNFNPATNQPRHFILLLAFAGWISMEIFIVFLFRDSYFRPLVPYSIFPILAVWGIVDTVIQPSQEVPEPTPLQKKVLGAVSGLLIGTLLLGNLLILRPSLARSSGPEWVSGKFPVDMAELQRLGIESWMFKRGVPMEYRLRAPLPPPLTAEVAPVHGTFCLSYRRRRFPKTLGVYGDVWVTPGNC